MKWVIRLIFFLLFSPLLADERCGDGSLFYDLEMAKLIEDYERAIFPISYNHIYSTGYFTTFSARMTEEGVIGLGAVEIPPYLNLNGLVQLFPFLELSVNYRIFHGVKDEALSDFGFGDYADRGANAKLGLITPEASGYDLPGFAIGVEDFMGSKKFTTFYGVATKIFRSLSLEASLGWGVGRFSRSASHGWFGGLAWYPFWLKNPIFSGLGFIAEFDPVNYKHFKCEPSPRGRVARTPINAGIKYSISDNLQLTASRVRGDAWAYGGSFQYNWGKTKGLIPKLKDPPVYQGPRNYEPLGCVRDESLFVENLAFILCDQGFNLVRAYLLPCKTLVLSVINLNYREECIVRMRLQAILASLIPDNIDEVRVVIESHGLPCQSYIFTRDLLLRFACNKICPLEFDLLTPRCEASSGYCSGELLYLKKPDIVSFGLSPRFETFFGSSKGKFKYDLGIRTTFDGYFPYNLYYDVGLSYTVLSTFHGLADYDFFFPSQLPNVATDYINYRQRRRFSVDRAYLEKNWNLGSGFFARGALGYFQVNYAGASGELLWYPASSIFAIGVEGALLKKREYTGIGFQSKIRHFKGKKPVFRPYTILPQYFLDFYFDIPELSSFIKVQAGHFLAGDVGLRLEATRYFESGLRLTIWTTVTNAHDKIHGSDYYNKGVAIEIPFDFFFPFSSRRTGSYGMAAWLRDAGYSSWTGRSLFNIINNERR